jgi:hypothetical protein
MSTAERVLLAEYDQVLERVITMGDSSLPMPNTTQPRIIMRDDERGSTAEESG